MALFHQFSTSDVMVRTEPETIFIAENDKLLCYCAERAKYACSGNLRRCECVVVAGASLHRRYEVNSFILDVCSISPFPIFAPFNSMLAE